MRSRRLLIVLLLVAMVLVDVAAMSAALWSTWPQPQPGWPDLPVIVVHSLALSQVGLMALWAGLGGTSLPWRLMGMILGVTGWGGLLALVQSDSRCELMTTIWTAVLLGQTLAMLGALLIAWAEGVRLIDTWRDDSPQGADPDSDSDRPRLQFSLGYLFSWITCVAVILGMLQYTIHSEFLPREPDFWGRFVVLSIVHAAIGLAAVWTALGVRRALLRVAVLCLACCVAIAVRSMLTRLPGYDFAYAVLCVLHVLLLLGPLWVFRVAGYGVAVCRG